MRRSIRSRLQWWYATVLLVVLGCFAGLVYYRIWAARFQEIDHSLEAAALYLHVNLRRFPPHELDGRLPHKPPPPPDWEEKDWPGGPPPHQDWKEKGKPGKPPPFQPDWLKDKEGPGGGPPPRPNLERLLAELTLPRGFDTPERERYFAVWRSDGSVLKSSNLPAEVAVPAFSETSPSQPRLSKRGGFREAVLLGPQQTRILVGRSIRKDLAELNAFAWQLVGVGVVVLVGGLAGGWWISARILGPIATISETASAISATHLWERIDPEKVDRELAELAQVLNAMFDRLEGDFERQARFTADASHELRTPLAILRTHAELALSRSRSPAEYQDTLRTCLRATDRMGILVEGLLTLARADAGRLDLLRQPVDLRQVVEESVTLLRPLAESRQVQLTVDLEAVEVTGDASRLAQVVTNLVSNAVQYNRPGGQACVRLCQAAGMGVLSVTDTGCGIAEEHRPHLFERFYRVDAARSRASGGNGLGLAICKSIVEAHEGAIGLTTELGSGSTFWVRLPCQ